MSVAIVVIYSSTASPISASSVVVVSIDLVFDGAYGWINGVDIFEHGFGFIGYIGHLSKSIGHFLFYEAFGLYGFVAG